MIIIGTCASKDNPVIAAAVRAAIEWLVSSLRRFAGRRFAMTDAEAHWWGWQITETSGGLGRRYRDRRFDTLGEVSQLRESTAGSGTAGMSSA